MAMGDNAGGQGGGLGQGTLNLAVQALNRIAAALAGGASIPTGSVQSTAGSSAGYAPVTVGGKTYVVQIFNPS